MYQGVDIFNFSLLSENVIIVVCRILQNKHYSVPLNIAYIHVYTVAETANMHNILWVIGTFWMSTTYSQ